MQFLDRFITSHPGRVFAILLLLSIPAFFINLGLLPLFADEPTRANVALEMLLSGNYSVPTIASEYYYNKPPVYNWLLAAVYSASGSFSEFATRLPALVPLLLFAITIYYSVNYFLRDKRIALVSAMWCLLNGRMLIYDSMLGHIDIFYSWLTFVGFISIFYFYERQRWFLLFFVSYLITAITFLCKGLPSIVFQGLSIITFLVYTGNYRRILSWQHLVSGVICLMIIGAYFANYSFHNSNLSGYLATIWDQSSQRTASEAGVGKSIKHLFIFPFEYAGHLFPASLLLLFTFKKGFLAEVLNNGFLKFCAAIFLANIWIYWLSPETRPRYLLMLFPLLFIICTYAYFRNRVHMLRLNNLLDRVFICIGILVTVALATSPYLNIAQFVPGFALKLTCLLALSGLCTWLLLRLKNHRLIIFLGLLIVVRLAFSWLILPYRLHHQDGMYYRNAAEEMGIKSGNSPFYLYQYHPAVANIPFHHKLIFYIQRARMKQVKFSESDRDSGYYLTFDRNLQNPKAVLVKAYDGNLKLYHVK